MNIPDTAQPADPSRSCFFTGLAANFRIGGAILLVAALLPAPLCLAQGNLDFGGPAVELPKDGTTEHFWQLSFRIDGLKMVVPEIGPGKGQVFWYLLYTLENPSSENRDAFLSITATSDRGKRYADMYLPLVEGEIEKKEGYPLWGKTDEVGILERRDPKQPDYNFLRINAGEKRVSVAVFNRLDPNANHVTIRIQGLSNEIKRVETPEGIVLEEKVYELTFNRPGDEFAVTRDTFRLVNKAWKVNKVNLASVAVDDGADS